MSGAYTVDCRGVLIRWHLGTLSECVDQACPWPHASKAQLSEGLEWDRDAGYEAGKDAGKGDR